MALSDLLQPTKVNAARWVLIYYWGGISFFNADLPLIISETNIGRLTMIAVGYLLYHSFGNDFAEKEIEYLARIDYLEALNTGQKLITSWGVYNWTGEIYDRNINGDKYVLCYEGINYMGSADRTGMCFLFPKSHIEHIGPHLLIKSDFERVEADMIPDELQIDVQGYWILRGDILASKFGTVDSEDISLIRQLKIQTDHANKLIHANKEISKQVFDALMLSTAGQPNDSSTFEDMINYIDNKIPFKIGGGDQ